MSQNVFLVVLDTARADAFGPYGAGDGATPTIDQLSRSGHALQHAVAPASWTVPSHASMFTGMLPRDLGIHTISGVDPAPFREVMERRHDVVLAEVLRRAGYSTRAVSANFWVRPEMGFAIGFDEFSVVHGERNDKIQPQGWRDQLSWDLDAWRATADDGAEQAEAVIDGWLQGVGKEPFFWFVNLVECHSPYLPPKPYSDIGVLGRLRAAREAQRHYHLDAIWRACAGGFDIPSSTMARMRHLYGRSIRQMDDWLARVLERLERSKVLDDTLVVVVSDHGENLGENELVGHSFSLDQRLISIPWISSGPGAIASESPMSLADLPRVLGRALDLPDQPWGDDLCRGIAVAQQDPPFDPADPRVRGAVLTWGLGESAVRRVSVSRTAATDGRYKLLLTGANEEVFDLTSDPLEERPISLAAVGAGPAAAIDKLRKAALSAGPVQGKREVTPRAPEDDNEDLERRLRLLGYM